MSQKFGCEEYLNFFLLFVLFLFIFIIFCLFFFYLFCFIFLVEIFKGTPAKEYEFNLDAFQKQAILCLENNQSVLVVRKKNKNPQKIKMAKIKINKIK